MSYPFWCIEMFEKKIIKIFLALFFVLLLLTASLASAEPLAQIERDGVRIVIYSDPWELKERVVNLPRRAEWTALGRVFQGCWTLSPLGIVVLFFDDLTVTAIPVSIFSQVREI